MHECSLGMHQNNTPAKVLWFNNKLNMFSEFIFYIYVQFVDKNIYEHGIKLQ